MHGHWSATFAPVNEILPGDPGNLESQVHEVDADGYAAYLALENLLNGSLRPTAIELLQLQAFDPPSQDSVLLSCFVLANGAYSLLRDARDRCVELA